MLSAPVELAEVKDKDLLARLQPREIPEEVADQIVEILLSQGTPKGLACALAGMCVESFGDDERSPRLDDQDAAAMP